MKVSDYLRHPLLLFIAFFLLLFAYSKFGPNLPISMSVQMKGEPLMVSAEGRVVVPNDTAKISAGVEESSSTLSAAQEAANTKSQRIVSALRDLGIADEDIETTSYNIFPQEDFSGGTPRVVGYRVSINYSVKVKDINKVNEVLVALTTAGANVVGSVSFEVDEEKRNEKLNEARQEAVEKAKEKAQGLASAAGLSLGRITNVSEFENIGGPIPANFPDARGGVSLDAVREMPAIQPGTNEIVVTVNLTYEVR